jgi:diguanylate cyclase (GGDEF)-like protein/PAS domain S-box-containing protein
MTKTQFTVDAEILAASKAAVLAVTSEGEILSSNPAAATLVDAIREGHTPEVMGFIGRAAVTGKTMNESVLLPGPGGPVYYELAILPLADQKAVMVFGRDVTLERNLRLALVESRQRYKDLVEISSDFSWETGLDGRFVFVTPRGALGYSAEQLVGSQPMDILSEGNQDQASLFSARAAVEDSEVWMRRADDSLACVLVSSAPLLGPAGEWRGARGVCRDITQVRERDAALAQAANRERLLTYIVRTIRDEVDPANMLTAAAEATARALSSQGCQIFRVVDERFDQAASFGNHGDAQSVQGLLANLQGGATTAELSMNGWQVLSSVTRYHREANGAICVWRKEGAPPFNDDDRLLILDVANQIGIANEQIANHERILNLSRTDGLTGLFNRRAFFEEVERRFNRLARDRRPAALIYVDLDNFKMVNDVHGHQKGDEALLSLKTLLIHNTRPIDLVARLGGDEFAVWLENADLEVAEKRAQVLLDASKILAELSGSPEKILGCSLGIAVHDPRYPETLEGMIARADEAMYEVKRSGKGSYRIAQDAKGGGA